MKKKKEFRGCFSRMISRRKWILVICVVASFFIPVKFPPQYRVSVEIQFVLPPKIKNEREIRFWLAEQVRELKSFNVVEQAAKDLGLVTPYMNDSQIIDVVTKLNRNIDFELLTSTRSVRLFIVSDEDFGLAEILNKMFSVYMKGIDNPQISESQIQEEAIDVLSKAKLDLEKELRKAEEILLAAEHELRIFTDQMVTYNVGENEKELARLRSELENLMAYYTEQHPEVISLNKKIIETEKHLEKIRALSSKQALKKAELQKKVDIAKREYGEIKNKIDYIYAREQEAQRQKVEAVATRAQASIVDVKKERLLSSSLKVAKRLKYLLFSLMIGLMLSLTLEKVDRSIWGYKEVRPDLGLSPIGVIPKVSKVKDKSGKESVLVHNYPSHSAYAQGYESLRTSLQFANLALPIKTITITSSYPKEGVALTGANLAISLAQIGSKVALVDADLRFSVIHKMFNLDSTSGLTDLLKGESSLQEVIKNTDVANLKIITCGSQCPNVGGVLDKEKISITLENLKKVFDTVIIVTPALFKFTDGYVFASQSDRSIIVVRVKKTPREAIRKTKSLLESVNARILGVVLNETSSSGLGKFHS